MDPELEIREIQALMRLIDEPDTAVFLEISRKIHSYGPGIIPYLEHEWEQYANPEIQDRIISLIGQIQFESVKGDLQKWVENGCRDLLEAWLIVSRYQDPQLSETDIEVEIARIRKDVWLEMNDNLTALEQIKVFNHVFFDVHGFIGNTKDYHAPANSFLPAVLKNRKGNPLSIGILYMLVAQSLDLPVFGVNLPEHFMLAYTFSEYNQEAQGMMRKVLFYINAFTKGIIYSMEEVTKFIHHLGYDPLSVYLEPCGNEDIIRRMLNNLANAYDKEGQLSRVHDMELLGSIINPQELP